MRDQHTPDPRTRLLPGALPSTLLGGLLLVALAACGDNGPPTGFGGDDPSVPEETEEILLEVPQWNTNHNGGGLTFDNDGFLFLGLGDGGGSGDDEDNGQDATNLLGSILRLEVLADDPFYAAPADNPFTGDFDTRGDEQPHEDIGAEDHFHLLFETVFALGGEQGVDQFGGAGEEHAVALEAGLVAEGGGEVGLAEAAASEEDDVGFVVDEAQVEEFAHL